MLPSTESRLPSEVLIYRRSEIFPAKPLRNIEMWAAGEGDHPAQFVARASGRPV